jgi:hypothetical protein
VGLFSGLEGNLEKYIEGFFKDKFKSRVQPAEIAKQLAREMRNNRRVSVSNTYVPNEYTVILHPEDWESIGAFNQLLALELQDYLLQKAEEKGFTLVGHPVVTVEKNEETSPGNITVQSNFGEAVPVNLESLRKEQPPREVEADEDVAHTQMFKPVKDAATLPTKTVSSGKLTVAAGHDAGKVFILSNYPLTVGRRDLNDIVLKDPSISRRHAQFEYVGGTYILTDLNSTNGTYINGVRITQRALEPGDEITFGTTVCNFKVESHD